jgi:quinol monooxygenase YgiN
MHAIIYRYHVDSDQAERFQEGWRRCSTAIRSTFGSYGARLHRSEDGLWVAYGRWPSAAARELHLRKFDFDPASSDLMRGSIRQELPEIRLEIVEDLLDEPAGGGR